MVFFIIDITLIFILFVVHKLVLRLLHLEITHGLSQNWEWQLTIAVFLDPLEFGFLL